MNNEEEMSNTFVAEVGQKSAVANNDDVIETLDPEETKEQLFPDVKIDPPTGAEPIGLDENKQETTEMANEFVEENKELRDKKSHPLVVFVIMIFCLGLGAFASYYYFEIFTANKSSDKETIKEEPKIVEEQLQPTSRFVIKLIDKYSTGNDLEDYTELYSKEKTNVSDLSVNYAQILGVLNIRDEKSFSKDELQVSVDELFGNGVITLDGKDIVVNDCYKLKYSEDNYSLVTSTGCKESNEYVMKTKIVKASKTIDTQTITVNVAVAITDGNKIYKSYDSAAKVGKEEIETLSAETLNMDSDYAKFDQYKYIFKYDSNNNDYYLDSITKEK